MATGIPRTKWQGGAQAPAALGNDAGNTDVHLAYDGKKSEHEILDSEPAACRQLWPEHRDEAAANRLYFGTSLGKLFRLDNANTGNPSPVDISGSNFPAEAV